MGRSGVEIAYLEESSAEKNSTLQIGENIRKNESGETLRIMPRATFVFLEQQLRIEFPIRDLPLDSGVYRGDLVTEG